MRSGNRLVMVFLLLLCVMLIGMVTASWRVVLYPYLVVIGIILLLGLGQRLRRQPVFVGTVTAITVAYLALYFWMDATFSRGETAETGLIAGLLPSTAIYFFAIWPLGLLVGLVYALSHKRIMGTHSADGPPPASGHADDGDVVSVEAKGGRA